MLNTNEGRMRKRKRRVTMSHVHKGRYQTINLCMLGWNKMSGLITRFGNYCGIIICSCISDGNMSVSMDPWICACMQRWCSLFILGPCLAIGFQKWRPLSYLMIIMYVRWNEAHLFLFPWSAFFQVLIFVFQLVLTYLLFLFLWITWATIHLGIK